MQVFRNLVAAGAKKGSHSTLSDENASFEIVPFFGSHLLLYPIELRIVQLITALRNAGRIPESTHDYTTPEVGLGSSSV